MFQSTYYSIMPLMWSKASMVSYDPSISTIGLV